MDGLRIVGLDEELDLLNQLELLVEEVPEDVSIGGGCDLDDEPESLIDDVCGVTLEEVHEGVEAAFFLHEGQVVVLLLLQLASQEADEADMVFGGEGLRGQVLEDGLQLDLRVAHGGDLGEEVVCLGVDIYVFVLLGVVRDDSFGHKFLLFLLGSEGDHVSFSL